MIFLVLEHIYSTMIKSHTWPLHDKLKAGVPNSWKQAHMTSCLENCKQEFLVTSKQYLIVSHTLTARVMIGTKEYLVFQYVEMPSTM